MSRLRRLLESGIPPSAGEGYERRDVRPGCLALFAFGFLAVLAIHLWGLVVLQSWFLAWDPPGRYAQGPPSGSSAPPAGAPRLSSEPQAELGAVRRQQETLLGSYGWVDRRRGLVRVPVARAVDVLVEGEPVP